MTGDVAPRYIVIVGMSGAGRSSTANYLEDLGWFVIDNVPADLVAGVAEWARSPRSAVRRVALVVGAGARQNEVLPMVAALRSTPGGARMLFLDASTDVLVRRYRATRRRHPLSQDGEWSLVAAIEREREVLATVRREADITLDSSGLNFHELRARVEAVFGDHQADGGQAGGGQAGAGQAGGGLHVNLMSFGYKHGLPLDADLVLDCRFLPNPHWVAELRPLSGLDAPVREYVLSRDAAEGFFARMRALLEHLLPAYAEQDMTCLTVAVGCTGGRHRSVAVAERLAAGLRGLGHSVSVSHRDVAR